MYLPMLNFQHSRLSTKWKRFSFYIQDNIVTLEKYNVWPSRFCMNMNLFIFSIALIYHDHNRLPLCNWVILTIALGEQYV